MSTLNFKAKIRLFDFDVQTGISTGYLFCPALHKNQVVQIDYNQYQYLIGLCAPHINKHGFYGRMINDNIFIIDRCFAEPIINKTFGN